MAGATDTDMAARRFARYWGANMPITGVGPRDWPGFTYTDEEWARLMRQGASVSGTAVTVWFLSTTVIFIVLAAAVMFPLMVVLLPAIFPVPGSAPTLLLVSALFGSVLLIIGFGLPVAMRLASWLSDCMRGSRTGAFDAADIALGEKVRRQIWRMAAILCGAGIPGTMMLIIYDLDLGPVVKWLKIAAYAGLAFSMFGSVRVARRPL